MGAWKRICPNCEGEKQVGEVCSMCNGVGSVPVSKLDELRDERTRVRVALGHNGVTSPHSRQDLITMEACLTERINMRPGQGNAMYECTVCGHQKPESDMARGVPAERTGVCDDCDGAVKVVREG